MGIFLAILAVIAIGFAWKYHAVALDFFRSEEPKVAQAAANLIERAETAIQGAEAELTGQPEATPSAAVSAAPAAATPATPTQSPAATSGYHREVISGGPGQPDVHVVTDGGDRPQETIVVKGGRRESKGSWGNAPYPYAYPPAPPQPPIPPDPTLPIWLVGGLIAAFLAACAVAIVTL